MEEHDSLLRHLSALRASHGSGQQGMMIDLARLLQRWLCSHTQGKDKERRKCLRRLGGSRAGDKHGE
jgi:hemerythrin